MIASKWENLMASVKTATQASTKMDMVVEFLQSSNDWVSKKQIAKAVYFVPKCQQWMLSHIDNLLNYLVIRDYVAVETRKEEWIDADTHQILDEETVKTEILPYTTEPKMIMVTDAQGRVFETKNPYYSRRYNKIKAFQITRNYYKWNVKGV